MLTLTDYTNDQADYTQRNMFTDILGMGISLFDLYAINPDIPQAVYYDQDGDPENHRFYCGDQDCDYCFHIGRMLYDFAYLDITDLIGYVKYMEILERDGFVADYEMKRAYHTVPESESSESESSESNSSDDDDSSYDSDDSSDDDYDDISYGYNPVECEVDVDSFSMHKINYRNLRAVGGGSYGCVITDGKYAIKIGRIGSNEIETIKYNAKRGFAVPVYYFKKHVRISPKLVEAMNEGIPHYGDTSYADEYLRPSKRAKGWDAPRKYADIAVMGLAKPLLSHDDYEDNDRNKGYRIAEEMRNYCDDFRDSHPYNLGFYHGGLIVLDFELPND